MDGQATPERSLRVPARMGDDLYMETDRRPESGARPSLTGRKALVVGGTGGIGAEISRGLYARGADLLIHGRSAEKARAAAEALGREFPRSGGSARAMGFELSPGSVEEFAAAALAAGPIDVLVVAFGPFLQAPLEAIRPGDWVRMACLDLALPGALVSAFLPGMLAAGYGRILLFGGTRTDQIRGFSSNAAYAAAKTGLGSLAKSAARSGAGRGVQCVLVCPGLVETEYLSEAEKSRLAAKAPGGKLLPAREMAERALGLVLDDSGAFNGAIVAMDGGLEL